MKALVIRGFWRLRGLQVGRCASLDGSISIPNPRLVWIGEGTEIRRNSSFDTLAGTGPSPQIMIGNHCRLKENIWLASYGGLIEIGSNVLIGRNSVLHGHGGISIGAYSMLGPNVTILTAEHGHETGDGAPPFQLQDETSAPVSIGPNVWLGTDTTVIGGVSICSDVVVAAGAVVLESIETPGIYAGVPARMVRPL